jgi:UTP--glucose-1-phosphate uridylyltransferase
VPRAQQLIDAYNKTDAPVLALMPMDPGDSKRYGVPVVQQAVDEGLMRISGLVEKPKPEDAPSSYAAIGGYVVTPGIIEELRKQVAQWYSHRTGEVYLTDAINVFAAANPVYGQVIRGRWYDTGNPGDYLIAQFASALAHPEYGPLLRALVGD